MGVLLALSYPLIVAALCLYVLRSVFIYFRLRNFKGPRWTGITNWPHNLAILHHNYHEWFRDVNEKYGPIARVGPNLLITSSYEVWMNINNKASYKRSEWYYKPLRLEYGKDNVFSETDNEKHEQRRKQLAPGYSGRENLELESSIDARLQEFLDLIRSKYTSTYSRTVAMDLSKKVQFFTLDVISTVGLGRKFGMLENDRDVDDYAKSTAEGIASANVILGLGLGHIMQAPIIGKLICPSPKDNNGYGKMMATAFRFVDERAGNPADKRSDMLASFIRHGLVGDELRTEALEQILAGSDTTAGALRGIILSIMANPRVCGKLQREIDDVMSSENAAGEWHDIVSIAQTKQLPYLQAVIREGIRSWPPVTHHFPRDVPPGGDTVIVDGESTFLPGGTSIALSAYAMHHSEKIYGPDAKTFRPERWFEPDPDKLAAMTRANDLIFGYGRFQCLGKTIAQIEIGKAVFELFRRFDLTLVNPTRPWKRRNCCGLFETSDMWINVMERKVTA